MYIMDKTLLCDPQFLSPYSEDDRERLGTSEVEESWLPPFSSTLDHPIGKCCECTDGKSPNRSQSKQGKRMRSESHDRSTDKFVMSSRNRDGMLSASHDRSTDKVGMSSRNRDGMRSESHDRSADKFGMSSRSRDGMRSESHDRSTDIFGTPSRSRDGMRSESHDRSTDIFGTPSRSRDGMRSDSHDRSKDKFGMSSRSRAVPLISIQTIAQAKIVGRMMRSKGNTLNVPTDTHIESSDR